MQTARVKTAFSGATATPPQLLRRPSSTLHLSGDPLRTVSLTEYEYEVWNQDVLNKRHRERSLFLNEPPSMLA